MKGNIHPFRLGEDHLTIDAAQSIVSGETQVALSTPTIDQIKNAATFVDQIAKSSPPVYGINTGFGPLCTTKISSSETTLLQKKILQSHAVGLGDPIPVEVAKLMLLLKIHSLALGHSGISLPTLERLIWHFNQNIIPVVPSQGSVGASGDLAPLAHLSLPLIGEGLVTWNDHNFPAKEVLSRQGLSPIALAPKEGLALLNGTQFMSAHGIMICHRLHDCLIHADLISAMTVDALQGSSNPYLPALHQLRPHPGCVEVAHHLDRYLSGSKIMEAHADCDRVQDPYSIRCIPQVHGASRSAWRHLKDCMEIELNAVTDNPVILHDGTAISGGHFHGQPIALPMDYAALAAAELGNISDRRIYLMMEGRYPGVPKLLMKETGLNSGFMIIQYTSAALASENKSLCYPASADSIPTSLGQEDHVSMGSISALKTLRIIDNVEKILAIELLCASQALDFRRPLRTSNILEKCHAVVRKTIHHADEDRIFYTDIEKSLEIIRSRDLIRISNHFLNSSD